MKTTTRKFLKGLALTCAALVVASGGYYLLRYRAWTAYRNWSITRMNHVARDFIAAGDSRNALLTVRQVLRKRPNDATAWRLGVQAASVGASPEAVLFQRNLCRVEKTTANYLELMRLAVKHQLYAYAVEAIPAISGEARTMPEFHRLAADACRHLHRDLVAKYHLVSLLTLVPGDVDARMALAETEFDLDPAQLPQDWAARVHQLTAEQDVAARATLLELRAAVQRSDQVAASRLLDSLKSRTDLDPDQQMHVLRAMWQYAPGDAAPRLATLQHQVADRPERVVPVMEFLTANARAEAVRTWYPELPATTRQNERVKLAAGAALDACADWSGLDTLLGGARWKTNEALRLGLLTHGYRMAGRAADAAECWKLAVAAAGQDAVQAARLLRNVESWHWDAERIDLWWCLFNLTGRAEVREPLVGHEFRAGNTANLNKIFARVIESDPADEGAKNNFAYTSLLLEANSGRAYLLAEELYRAHPENATYRSTYALALFRQGRFSESLALFEKMDPMARARPGAMLPEAISAAAAGQFERANGLLGALDRASMLPEERGLTVAALKKVAQADLAAGRRTRVAERTPGAPAQGWLALLPGRAREATDDWRLADDQYSSGDFAALGKGLEGGRWGTAEHLRQALRAYAERRQEHETAAHGYWSQAVATAGRDPARLRELEKLSASWNWPAERAEVMDRRFEREPGDAALLADLMDYYRRTARTSDLARVLWLHVNQSESSGSEAAWCVYYSLLCGSNLSAAQTLAARSYAAGPGDPRRRAAYAFSLWRQGRAREALELLQDPAVQGLTDMQVGLVEAGALLQLGRTADARARLSRVSGAPAMPEEIALANTLFRQAGLPAPAMAMNNR